MNWISEDTLRRHRWLPCTAVFAFYVFANQVLTQVSRRDWNQSGHELFELVLVGVTIAQPAMIGIWTALGPGSILVRGPLAITALSYAILATDVNRFSSLNEQQANAEFIAAAVTIYVLTFCIALWKRRSKGYEIVDVLGNNKESMAQFGIKYLLGLTAAWAILFAVFGQTDRGIAFRHLPVGAAVNSAVLLLILSPTVIVALVYLSANERWRSALETVVGVGGALSLFILLAAATLLGAESADSAVTSFTAILSGTTICGLVSTWVLRRSGYRLLRRIPIPG